MKLKERERFNIAIKFVLKWEGGETVDTGGHTKYGISKRAHPEVDIDTLTKEGATEIYYNKYWKEMKCDKMNFALAYAMLDTGVNLGTKRAENFHYLSGDWKELLLMRIKWYSYLAKKPKYRRYLRGWIARVADLFQTLQILTIVPLEDS